MARKNEELFKKVALDLREKSLNAGGSERLVVSSPEWGTECPVALKDPAKQQGEYFIFNDPYKVCYRLIGNMTSGWVKLGLNHFPTEEEAIEIARKVDPYFGWLFDQPEELDAFKRTYEFHKDVWDDPYWEQQRSK